MPSKFGVSECDINASVPENKRQVQWRTFNDSRRFSILRVRTLNFPHWIQVNLTATLRGNLHSRPISYYFLNFLSSLWLTDIFKFRIERHPCGSGQSWPQFFIMRGFCEQRSSAMSPHRHEECSVFHPQAKLSIWYITPDRHGVGGHSCAYPGVILNVISDIDFVLCFGGRVAAHRLSGALQYMQNDWMRATVFAIRLCLEDMLCV